MTTARRDFFPTGPCRSRNAIEAKELLHAASPEHQTTMNTALREPTQAELDAALEQRIEQARITMTATTDTQARREAYEDLRWLISQRSAQKVAEMEARLPEPWRS